MVSRDVTFKNSMIFRFLANFGGAKIEPFNYNSLKNPGDKSKSIVLASKNQKLIKQVRATRKTQLRLFVSKNF